MRSRKTAQNPSEKHELTRFFLRSGWPRTTAKDLALRILLVGEEQNLHMANLRNTVANLPRNRFGLFPAPGVAKVYGC